MASMSQPSAGTFDIRSFHSVPETLNRLVSIAKNAGLGVFARIDFSGDAQRAGLSIRPMQMLLFGNPKAGTPLLVASPRSGLDLPLKALAWEDETGAVWVSSNTPEYIQERHALPSDLVAKIAGARGLIAKAAEA
jgi:uncharacterized protein (DUF302 family)